MAFAPMALPRIETSASLLGLNKQFAWGITGEQGQYGGPKHVFFKTFLVAETEIRA